MVAPDSTPDREPKAVIRLMEPGEEKRVCALVNRVFLEFVAGDFSPEGVRTFEAYNSPGPLSRRNASNHFCLVAEREGRLVGMIEMRETRHLSQLFVEERGQGLGKALFRKGLALSRESSPGMETVTVHSSRYAVRFYTSLGFRPIGPEETRDGVTFIPMALRLEGADAAAGVPVVRRAEAPDYKEMTALLGQLGYPSDSHKTIIRMALVSSREDHAVFVAEAGGAVTGFVHVCTVLRLGSDPFAEIAGLVVDGRYRRSGTGRRLVEAAEGWAVALGCRRLRIRMNELRTETPDFYSSLGYTGSKKQMVFEKDL